MTRFCSLLVLLALAVPASADELKLEAVLPWANDGAPAVAFSQDGKTLWVSYPGYPGPDVTRL